MKSLKSGKVWAEYIQSNVHCHIW